MSIPSTPPENQKLSYLNIEITEKGLSEFSDGRRIIFVPKDKVQRIRVEFGPVAESPLTQGIAGFALVGLGCIGLKMIMQEGIVALRWGLGFVVFGGLGVWLLYETFKKTHYLRVIGHTDNETRKLLFKGAFQEAEFSEFIKGATQFGYNFENHVNSSNGEASSS
jgi:hypothetical protein